MVLQVPNSQSSRGVHWSSCVFLCSRCWESRRWDLRGNVVRMKAAGSLSSMLKSPIRNYVLLHWSCFDTWIMTSLVQCCCRLKPQADLEVTMPHLSSPVMLHSPYELAEKVTHFNSPQISEVVLYPSIIVPGWGTTSELGFQNLSKFLPTLNHDPSGCESSF